MTQTNSNSQDANFVVLPISISVKTEDLSASSLHEIGFTLYNEQQYECAMEFFVQAAERGDQDVYLKIGNMYEQGHGVKQDCLQAMSWYKKAAMMGIISAKIRVAKLYEEGSEKIERSLDKARRWYLDAANDNSIDAILYLASMHERGAGAKKSAMKACSWYEKAADLGSAEGAYKAGRLYEDGKDDGNQTHQNHTDIKKSTTKACSWYEKAASLGSAKGAFRAGHLYENGKDQAHQNDINVKRNIMKAFSWYEKAASLGSAKGAYKAGRMYSQGEGGVAQSYKKAIPLYEQAAAEDHSDALQDLGSLYYYGCGVSQDFHRAFEYFMRGAEQGNCQSKYNMGVLYEHSQGTTKNIDLALKNYEEAKKGGEYCDTAIARVKKYIEESKQMVA